MEGEIQSVAETFTINEEGNNTSFSTIEAEIMLLESKTNSKTSKKWAHAVQTALLNLSSWCLVMVEQLFLAMPWGCLHFVIVVFPDHTHLLFFK